MKAATKEEEEKEKRRTRRKKEKKEQEKQEKQDEKTTGLNKFNKWINDEEIDLNEELFKKYFNFQKPGDMLMLLNKTNDKTKSTELVNVINSGLENLKEEIKICLKRK